MRFGEKWDWFSYFWSGALALICSWVLSITLTGCRFGNQVVNQSNPDSFSGYYELQPQKLTFCSTQGSTQCSDDTPQNTPSLISAIYTDPVIFAVTNLSNGSAVFASYPDLSNQLPVILNPTDSSFSIEGTYTSSILWIDPDCLENIEINETGKLVPGGPFNTGAQIPLTGRVQMSVQVITRFDGSCTQTLQTMASCYQDVTQCGGTSAAQNSKLQAQAQALFAPYLNAKAMTTQDIADTASLSYDIEYQ